MAITHSARIDMVPGGIPVLFHVGQYDDDFSIILTPFASTGSFSIPSGTTAEVRGTKRDGNGYSAEATINMSVVPFTVTVAGNVQMTAIAGENEFELVFTRNGKVLSTANFILMVEHAAMDAETIASESVIREIGTVVDEYLEEHDTALLAKKVNTPLSGGEADYGTEGQVLSTLGDGTTEWIDAAQGGGLTDEAKDALLACFAKVAWIDDDGQDYYDALHDALYPPADLVSISAVYTQSGTVYDTDTLDSLKADLVVTATYSDSTTATVTSYTLSGTLEEGTSTVTVSYGGKTTTFTVTVTASALYPMPSGSATFTHTRYAGKSVAVSNGNHVKFTAESTTSNYGVYAIIDDVSNNGTAADTANINAPSTPIFTLPEGASVVFKLNNIQYEHSGGDASAKKYAVALRSGSTSVVSTGDLGESDTSKTVTTTIQANTNITCAFAFVGTNITRLEFDVELTVNGVQWI